MIRYVSAGLHHFKKICCGLSDYAICIEGRFHRCEEGFEWIIQVERSAKSHLLAVEDLVADMISYVLIQEHL